MEEILDYIYLIPWEAALSLLKNERCHLSFETDVADELLSASEVSEAHTGLRIFGLGRYFDIWGLILIFITNLTVKITLHENVHLPPYGLLQFSDLHSLFIITLSYLFKMSVTGGWN